MKLTNHRDQKGSYYFKKNDFVIFIKLNFRKRSLSPVETKKKKKKQRSLTEFINEDTTKTINDTEQLALYLLSK
jgi:hypothetical protein